MKKYTFNYLSYLGSFLDEQNIPWSHNDEQITLHLKSDNDLVNLLLLYFEWQNKL